MHLTSAFLLIKIYQAVSILKNHVDLLQNQLAITEVVLTYFWQDDYRYQILTNVS